MMKATFIALVGLMVMCGVASFRADPAVSNLSPQSIELRDLLNFLDVYAWKVRLVSDEPFNSIDVRLVRYERTNGSFTARPIGQSHGMVSLQKRSEQVIAVLWKKEGHLVRFQLGFPGHSQIDCAVPAESLAGYTAVGAGDGQAGMEVDGEHIIAVKWKKDAHGNATMGGSKESMDGYIAVEVELEVLKGISD